MSSHRRARPVQVLLLLVLSLLISNGVQLLWIVEAQEQQRLDGRVVFDSSSLDDEQKKLLNTLTVNARFIPSSSLESLDSLLPPRNITVRRIEYLLVGVATNDDVNGRIAFDGNFERTSTVSGNSICNRAMSRHLFGPSKGSRRVLNLREADYVVPVSMCQPAPSQSSWKYSITGIVRKEAEAQLFDLSGWFGSEVSGLLGSEELDSRLSGMAIDVRIATAKDLKPLASLVQPGEPAVDYNDEYIVVRIAKIRPCEGTAKFGAALVSSDPSIRRINVNFSCNFRLEVGEASYLLLSANELIPDHAKRASAKTGTWKVLTTVTD